MGNTRSLGVIEELIPSGEKVEMKVLLSAPIRRYTFAQLCSGDADQTHKPHTVATGDSLPLRVIDVSATLGSALGGVFFVVPANWDFHVISHTWSLEVRELSCKIADSLPVDASSETYNEVFKNEVDFSSELCYQSLREFFAVLASDGVERVWFDALCINQRDEDEKSREIRNMAHYYSLSQGCYVSTHGIGQGFQLWSHGIRGSLPRWFTRVWTFQELLLPTRLYFIVADIDGRTKANLNLGIRGCSKAGFCACLLKDGFPCIGYDGVQIVPPRWGRNMSMPTSFDAHIWTSIDPCSVCGELPFIRKVESHRGKSQAEMYFVDRLAYFFLAEVDLRSQNQKTTFPGIRRLSDLYSLLTEEGIHGDVTPAIVVAEIADRDCSNAEDRVLSVLGLLRVKGDLQQLRTGKTLDEQIVDMAKCCDEKTLLCLCLADIFGYRAPSMSWAPDFSHKAGQWMQRDPSTWSFFPTSHVNQVTKSGMVLSCRVMQGRVHPKHNARGVCNYGVDFQATYPKGEEIRLEISGMDDYMEMTSTSSTIFPTFDFQVKVRGGPPYSPLLQVELDVWVLILAEAKFKAGNEFDRSLGMVCLKQGEEFHKIGVCSFLLEETDLETTTIRECFVGGLGENLRSAIWKERETV